MWLQALLLGITPGIQHLGAPLIWELARLLTLRPECYQHSASPWDQWTCHRHLSQITLYFSSHCAFCLWCIFHRRSFSFWTLWLLFKGSPWGLQAPVFSTRVKNESPRSPAGWSPFFLNIAVPLEKKHNGGGMTFAASLRPQRRGNKYFCPALLCTTVLQAQPNCPA